MGGYEGVRGLCTSNGPRIFRSIQNFSFPKRKKKFFGLGRVDPKSGWSTHSAALTNRSALFHQRPLLRGGWGWSARGTAIQTSPLWKRCRTDDLHQNAGACSATNSPHAPKSHCQKVHLGTPKPRHLQLRQRHYLSQRRRAGSRTSLLSATPHNVGVRASLRGRGRGMVWDRQSGGEGGGGAG